MEVGDKSSGPRTELWETPEERGNGWDFNDLNRTECGRRDKSEYKRVQVQVFGKSKTNIIEIQNARQVNAKQLMDYKLVYIEILNCKKI